MDPYPHAIYRRRKKRDENGGSASCDDPSEERERVTFPNDGWGHRSKKCTGSQRRI